MKRITILLAIAIAATACGTSEPDPDVSGGNAASGVLAAAVLELITENHTFGDGPPPFTEYLLQASLDPSAGDPIGDSGTQARALTGSERAAIEAAVESFGTVRWIDEPAEWRTDDLRPTIEGAAIIGVGEPTFDEDGALVPVSLWCGGLCGTWLTYRLAETDRGWQVTGIEGPVAVS
jgi:hypothetical protein